MLDRVRQRLRMLTLSGRGRECPCCGSRWRRFASFRGRRDALCLRCGSLERHRALALLLRERPGLLAGRSVLHFAPEPSLRRILEPAAGSYTTTDLEPAVADVAADITDLPFDADSFELIVCSHVLEHVPDDRAALAELARVLAPHGTLIVMVPLEGATEFTDEDPTLTDPVERLRRFGQDDHVRRYGADITARIAAAGLGVERIAPPTLSSGPDCVHHGLRSSDEILLARIVGSAIT